ncbi:ankyrin repeat domain-containing protein [bacterium]|nr:MAG: ankyrin repeat domain-containing protein [bacterium]
MNKKFLGTLFVTLAFAANAMPAAHQAIDEAADEAENQELFNAVETGNIEYLQEFLRNGIDVNTKNDYDETLLHIAASRGQSECVQELLAHNADFEAIELDGMTPLYYASNTACTQLLLEKGANPNICDTCYHEIPLHEAVQTGNLEQAILLIKHGSLCNAKDIDGNTPLHLAALSGHLDCVQYLLESGANLEATNNDGQTAKDRARLNGHQNVVELLEYWAEIPDIKEPEEENNGKEEIVEVEEPSKKRKHDDDNNGPVSKKAKTESSSSNQQ